MPNRDQFNDLFKLQTFVSVSQAESNISDVYQWFKTGRQAGRQSPNESVHGQGCSKGCLMQT